MHKDTPALPSDSYAERTVLGAMILESQGHGENYELLTPEEFFDSRHKVVFSMLREMWERNVGPGLPVLFGELQQSKKLEEAGGVGYLSTLIDGIPAKLDLPQHRAKLKEFRARREVAALCEAIRNLVLETPGSPSELIDTLLERGAAIGKSAESEDRGDTYKEAATSLLFNNSVGEQIRVHTGIRSVDEMTGGFRSGELIVYTAETGVGKTFFALQTGKYACRAGHHVLYCSGEMQSEHLMGRVISSDANVDYYKIRRPELLTPEETAELVRSASGQCSSCRILDGELTLSRIRLAARTMSSNKELGIIIVDYDELVEVRGKDEWEQQRILTRSMKSLGMEIGVPVIMVSQLRKPLDDKDKKKPTLARLYGSGSKSKHASIVIHVDRPFVRELTGDETEAKIFILKSRDGRMGMTECRFNIRTLCFEE